MKGTVTSTMRKKILLTVLVLLGWGVHNAEAQKFSYHLGLTGGPNYTTFSSDLGEYKGKIGFHGGIVQEFRFADQKFGIVLEGLYNTVSADRKYNDSIPLFDRYILYKYDQTDVYRYMTANLMFKYNFNLGGTAIIPYDRPDHPSRVQLGVYLGPYISHLAFFSWDSYERSGEYTRYIVTNQGDTVDAGKTYKGDLAYPGVKDSSINPTDIGVVIGTELSFRIGTKVHLHAGIRYSRGLLSIDAGGPGIYNTYGRDRFAVDNQGNSSYAYVPASIFTNNIQLNVGIKYRLAASF